MIERFNLNTLKIMDFVSRGAVSRKLVSNGIEYLYGNNLYGKMFSPFDAIHHFLLAIAVNHSNADAYTELAIHGDGHLRLSEEDAIKYLNEAIKVDPNFFRAYLHRGLFKGAESLVALQMEDPTLEVIVKTDSKKAERSNDALCDYASAINYNPDFPYPYYDRGCLLYMWGMEDKAIADFEKISELSNDNHLKEISRKKIKEIEFDPKRTKRFKGKKATSIDLSRAIGIENKRRELIISRNIFYWHLLREPGRTTFEYDPKMFE